MVRPFRMLITSIEAYGHINATIGFGELVASHGHQVVFAQRQKYQHLAQSRGLGFIPFDESIIGSAAEESVDQWIERNMDVYLADPMVRWKRITEEEKNQLAYGYESFVKISEALSQVLARDSRFDVIAADNCDAINSIHNSGIPVIALASVNPLTLFSRGPPAFSGLSVNADQSEWTEFAAARSNACSEIVKRLNEIIASGNRSGSFSPGQLTLPLYHFGFYHYPSDLDYIECEPKRDPKWFRIDCFVRSPDSVEKYELPDHLKARTGKLVFLSLGSLGSKDLLVMRKLISACSKSAHRFIVSKGSKGDSLELAENMCGENYVDQLRVLQSVDLVITHGGNNTFMESLYYGKPMIVIPQFFDQYDNAQRVEDKKIGFRINPYDLDEDHLVDCIDSALTDQQLLERVRRISINMRASRSRDIAVQMIEDLVQGKRSIGTN